MKKLLLSFILISTLSFSGFSQCTITSPATIDITAGNFLYGQSFTATCNGFLNYVQFTANSTGTVSAGTLNVYSGNTLVTSIYNQAFSAITIANIGDPIRVNLSSALAITNGNQYTFEFTVDNVNVLAGLGTYAGGDSFQDGSAVNSIDFDFEVDITTTVGINEATTTDVTIFPNPATNVLNITTPDFIVTISIYNINGTRVKTANQKVVNISNLDQGMYLITVQTEKGIVNSKFIKD